MAKLYSTEPSCYLNNSPACNPPLFLSHTNISCIALCISVYNYLSLQIEGRASLRKIRLTDSQVAHIKDSFLHYFNQQDSLWLFGSRINIQKRGGDIDLYIETHYTDLGIVIAKKTSFLGELERRIGEQKIDVIINLLSANKNLPIYTEARTTGIKLI